MPQKSRFLREVVFPLALTRRWCCICRHVPSTLTPDTSRECSSCQEQSNWVVNPESAELKRFLNDDMDIMDWLKLYAESTTRPPIKTAAPDCSETA